MMACIKLFAFGKLKIMGISDFIPRGNFFFLTSVSPKTSINFDTLYVVDSPIFFIICNENV